MICCDKCEEWFHGKCVNVTKAMGMEMERQGIEWVCPNCLKKQTTPASQPPPIVQPPILQQQQQQRAVSSQPLLKQQSAAPAVIVKQKPKQSATEEVMATTTPTTTTPQVCVQQKISNLRKLRWQNQKCCVLNAIFQMTSFVATRKTRNI